VREGREGGEKKEEKREGSVTQRFAANTLLQGKKEWKGKGRKRKKKKRVRNDVLIFFS